MDYLFSDFLEAEWVVSCFTSQFWEPLVFSFLQKYEAFIFSYFFTYIFVETKFLFYFVEK